MAARPDPLDPSAPALLGNGAYRESQVSYGGATYWLERLRRRHQGVGGRGKRRIRLRRLRRDDPGPPTAGCTCAAETTPDNALALRSALPRLAPSRLGLHTSAGFGDRLGLATPGHVRALNAVGAAIRPGLRAAIHPGDGAVPPNAAKRARRCDMGGLPGGLDAVRSAATPTIWRSSPTSMTPRRPASPSSRWTPRQKVDPEAEHADPATVKAKVEALDWPGLESDLSGDSSRRTRGGASTSNTMPSSWTRARCCGPWRSTARRSPMPWPCIGV